MRYLLFLILLLLGCQSPSVKNFTNDNLSYNTHLLSQYAKQLEYINVKDDVLFVYDFDSLFVDYHTYQREIIRLDYRNNEENWRYVCEDKGISILFSSDPNGYMFNTSGGSPIIRIDKNGVENSVIDHISLGYSVGIVSVDSNSALVSAIRGVSYLDFSEDSAGLILPCDKGPSCTPKIYEGGDYILISGLVGLNSTYHDTIYFYSKRTKNVELKVSVEGRIVSNILSQDDRLFFVYRDVAIDKYNENECYLAYYNVETDILLKTPIFQTGYECRIVDCGDKIAVSKDTIIGFFEKDDIQKGFEYTYSEYLNYLIHFEGTNFAFTSDALFIISESYQDLYKVMDYTRIIKEPRIIKNRHLIFHDINRIFYISSITDSK